MFRHSLTTAMVVIASGAWLTSLHAQSAMPYPPMPSHDGSYSQMRMMPVSTSMPQPQAMPM